MTETILSAALEGLSLGIWPTPVRGGEKAPYLPGWQDRRIEADALSEFFSVNGDSDSLGWLWGIPPAFAADVDCDSSEAVTAASLISGPSTGRIFGPSGAPYSHYLFMLAEEYDGEQFKDPVIEKLPAAERKQKSMLVELRGRGQQSVVPPSPYGDGRVRAWKTKGDFGKTTYAELRAWVAKIAACALLARYWPNRTSSRMALVGILLRAGWTKEQTEEFVVAVTKIASPKDKKARRNATSVATNGADRIQRDKKVKGWATLRETLDENAKPVISAVRNWLGLEADNFPATDGANADRFVEQHAENLRYCTEQKIWYGWDARLWQRDAIGMAMRCARETAETIFKDARKKKLDEEKKKKRTKWAIHSDSRSGLESMVAIARYNKEVEAPKFDEVFDRDPLLLNCGNGVLNLKTGEFATPPRKDLFITRMTGVEWDQTKGAPRFLESLKRALPDDDVREYVQRICGYFATGLTSEREMYIFFGPDTTGKSTYVKILRLVLGSYADSLPEGALLVKKHEDPHDFADLPGVRLATTVETAKGRKLDVAKIKSFTGQDAQRTRHLYENSFEFTPRAKLLLATNHLPGISDTDNAIWIRIKAIEFSVQLAEDAEIKDYAELIVREEGPGILAWIAEGARKYLADGLNEPDAVREAVSKYRSDEDEVAEFISDTMVVDGSAKITKAALYGEYCRQTKTAGRRPMSKKYFGQEMMRLLYTEGTGRASNSWTCIRFNDETQRRIDQEAERPNGKPDGNASERLPLN